MWRSLKQYLSPWAMGVLFGAAITERTIVPIIIFSLTTLVGFLSFHWYRDKW